MYDWIRKALESNGQIITASRRLARELRQARDAQELAAGKTAWPTPAIVFIGDWLRDLLLEQDDAPVVIGAQASAVLWERCVATAMPEQLPGVPGVARQCRQAWVRLHDWGLDPDLVTSKISGGELALFADAAKLYRDILAGRNMVDDATLPGAVLHRLQAGAALPRSINLQGFDRLTPVQDLLLAALREAGCKVSVAVGRSTVAAVQLAQYADDAAQLRAAGSWARSQLLANNNLRIAIISADLDADSANAVRLVREGYAPGWQYGGDAHRAAVNVSYGLRLREYPAIATALLVLRWTVGSLRSADISILLRSRNIGGSGQGGQARLEQQLRWLPDRDWKLSSLLAMFGSGDVGDETTEWLSNMRSLLLAADHLESPRALSHWAHTIDQILQDAGWPGNTSLQSREFQLINRWRELLNELARLDSIVGDTTFAEAINQLTSMAADTVFQPESAAGELQLLGVLEAAGMEFDKIWISGFDASRWPMNGTPLSYLSRKLQRERNMPDATPADSLLFSRRVLERLLSSANDVVVSWAQMDDGVEQLQSPLLDDLPRTTPVDIADPGWHAATLLNQDGLLIAGSGVVPAVGGGEKIHGGAYTVQRQATDPFSGFATGRLGVNDLPVFQIGLSPGMRGQILHEALHAFFSELPDQATIRAWSDEEVQHRAVAAIGPALSKYQRQANPFLRTLIELEHARGVHLLGDLRKAELLREPYDIAALEQPLEFRSCGIQLRLRIDRIDQLADGRLLIIDYKTGTEKSLVDRKGDLYDLQLMVYALAHGGEIGGLALMNVDSRKISLRSSLSIADWPDVYAGWQRATETALNGIASGDARVNIDLSTDQGRRLNILSRYEELRHGQ